MQIHGSDAIVSEIEVVTYGSVAFRFPNGVSLVIESPADADEVIRAAIQAKSMLLGGPR